MEILIDFLPGFMFLALVFGLFSSLPVGIMLMGVTLIFGTIALGLGEMRTAQLTLLPNRIYGGIIENPVLVAAPMFVFMGLVLEKTRVADDLLIALQKLMRAVPGGLALAVTLVGTILAAATGIIGASVVMLTALALPTMIQRGYSPALAAGTIASAGTLGILIPPSVMLVFMGDLLTLNLAKLFVAALLPGLTLAGLYLVYIVVIAALKPEMAPKAPRDGTEKFDGWGEILLSLGLPFLLIVAVLGSILGGIATPTEASGVGAVAALVLGLVRGRLNRDALSNALDGSVRTIAMLFFIFVGATAFSYVFRLIGGEHFIVTTARSLSFGDWGLLIMMMVMIFIMGFFFDWIEITLIMLPIFAPIVKIMHFGDHVAAADMIYWFAILVAVNLQTSFLTPPFGFALFYLKGAGGAHVTMAQIYRGIVPFVLVQLGALGLFIWQPGIVTWLPNVLLGN
ncbi:TRAP transporter large permease [Tropicibacter sp. S64]|uniref:TRAP transporter large permease n=1 Tax=Tropicibacter sp. S64 TaxID=3415122 RepID=UPI003C7DEEAF